jgi:hypothetical protein
MMLGDSLQKLEIQTKTRREESERRQRNIALLSTVERKMIRGACCAAHPGTTLEAM